MFRLNAMLLLYAFLFDATHADCPEPVWQSLARHQATLQFMAQGIPFAQQIHEQHLLEEFFLDQDSQQQARPIVRMTLIGRQDSLFRTEFLSLSVWISEITWDKRRIQVPCWDQWALERMEAARNSSCVANLLRQLWNHVLLEEPHAHVDHAIDPWIAPCPEPGFCPKPWEDSLRALAPDFGRAQP